MLMLCLLCIIFVPLQMELEYIYIGYERVYIYIGYERVIHGWYVCVTKLPKLSTDKNGA